MSSKNIFQFLIIFHSKFRGQVLCYSRGQYRLCPSTCWCKVKVNTVLMTSSGDRPWDVSTSGLRLSEYVYKLSVKIESN